MVSRIIRWEGQCFVLKLASAQHCWAADREGQIRKQENASSIWATLSFSSIWTTLSFGRKCVGSFNCSLFYNTSKAEQQKLFWIDTFKRGHGPWMERTLLSKFCLELKWQQTPEFMCNEHTLGSPWTEMLPDTSARLFLLPPQDMGMLGGREERSRISAVNIAFLTIPGNSLQYCVGRLLWQES